MSKVFSRRALVAQLGTVIALPLALTSQSAQAQHYPHKPITLVVPVAAGGAADALARAWGDFVGKALGVPVVVDNKAGANGSIAAAYVAKQAPDGYTILLGSTSNMSLNPFSYKSLTYNPAKDFDPVLMLAGTNQVVVANPSAGIKSVADLVRQAKAKPGTVAFASAGKGNSTHLAMAFVAQHYGIELTHIPYRGAAPALMGVVGGETQLMSDALVTAVPQAKNGKVIPLVIMGANRSAALPDVPTVYELGMKDFPAGGWYGLMVPKGTPKAVVQLLNAETKKFWADGGVKTRMDAMFMEPPAQWGPEAVAQTMQSEAKVWGPIIHKLDIQND